MQTVGVVGPCTSGKSTLINNMRDKLEGIELRHKAQEHSYVQTMWQRINPPDYLIFLDVSYAVSMQRKNLNWTAAEYQEQQHRLEHARAHADLYIDTDDLTPDEVVEKVFAFLAAQGLIE